MISIQMFVAGLMSVPDTQLLQAYAKAGSGLNKNKDGQNSAQGRMPFRKCVSITWPPIFSLILNLVYPKSEHDEAARDSRWLRKKTLPILADSIYILNYRAETLEKISGFLCLRHVPFLAVWPQMRLPR